jgi:hypothetical protein
MDPRTGTDADKKKRRLELNWTPPTGKFENYFSKNLWQNKFVISRVDLIKLFWHKFT